MLCESQATNFMEADQYETSRLLGLFAILLREPLHLLDLEIKELFQYINSNIKTKQPHCISY